MTRTRLLGALLCGSLLAAACGEDGEADPAADRQTARRATNALEDRLRDNGFRQAADDDDEDDDDFEFESEECQRFAAAFPEDDEELPGETASSESAEFERGELTPTGGVEETVQGFVGVVEESGDLDEVFDLLADERLGGCLEEVFRKGVEEGAAEDNVTFELTGVSVEQIESGVGDQSAGVQISGVLETLGFRFPFGFEIEFVREGRTVVGIVVSAVGGDTSITREPLLELMLDEAAG